MGMPTMHPTFLQGQGRSSQGQVIRANAFLINNPQNREEKKSWFLAYAYRGNVPTRDWDIVGKRKIRFLREGVDLITF